jgi:hypothetical protein
MKVYNIKGKREEKEKGKDFVFCSDKKLRIEGATFEEFEPDLVPAEVEAKIDKNALLKDLDQELQIPFMLLKVTPTHYILKKQLK